MKKIDYPQLNETLYTKVLDNGLTVTLLPKRDFHKTYGIFTTQYGSIDNEFTPIDSNQKIKVPDGIAHFLEHKMFEKEDGDVFQTFGKFGASANAFTSFTQTSYLFSCTDYLKQNVETLLDFVQAPYFTEQTVNKEKGIIGQEIQMYQDEPYWRLLLQLLENLYPKHPVHIDIVGTIESIDQITAEDLYRCYHTFYHPENMTFFMTGHFDPDEMIQLIENNQAAKTFDSFKKIERFYPEEAPEDVSTFSESYMDVTRPKCAVGWRGFDVIPEDSAEKIRYRFALSLFFQLLVGNASSHFQTWYDSGLIDDTFSYEVTLDRSFHLVDINSDTEEPQVFAEKVLAVFEHALEDPALNQENLDRLKKKMIGKYLQSLNSLEYIAQQFSKMKPGDLTIFDWLPILESIQLADVVSVGEQFLTHAVPTTSILWPLDKEEK